MTKNMRAKPLSSLGRIGRSVLKRFMYSQLAILSGIKIVIGKEKPLVRFTVENDPPSIYWVYRIRPSEIERLAREIGLPEHFSISPIQCLEGEAPEYWLTINAYRVSGLANGLRAEWSVFIHDAESTPRYLVVDARSSQFSVDPVDIITRASTVVHERRDGKLHTQIGEGEDVFKATMTISDSASPITISREWITANDYIYWGNGICDRTFYDAGLANTKQNRIEKENYEITDRSFWSQFVEPEPAHVLVLPNAIEFVISPWENIDRIQVR